MLDHGRVSASGLANVGARILRDVHAEYRTGFDAITRRAGSRFAARMWRELRDDADERIDLYGREVDRAVASLTGLLGERGLDRIVWASLKAVYSGLHMDDPRREVAETFFNSVTRRVFHNVGVDPDIEFVHGDADVLPVPEHSIVERHRGLLEEQVAEALRRLPMAHRMTDLEGDATRVATRVAEEVGPGDLEVIRTPFYREQGAYVVGRVATPDGPEPVVICLRHPDDGVVVDAVVTDPDQVSIMFGFTRSHFLVPDGPPAELVRFLRSILPHKRVAELYVAIGEYKHGKTELYRDLVDHLRSGAWRFVPAPGTAGLVMVVFALDGFDMVLKVIRDRFAPPKQTTRRRVMDRYRFVFHNDRAGRLVEAHEFEHLRIPRERFEPSVVEALGTEAAATVRVDESHVTIDHAYVERRVDPLDVFLSDAEGERAAAAVRDYGRAIEQLACTDVFCGDILPKNFGLTRNRRVVFYDYDELDRVTAQRFRAIPADPDPLAEMSAEPWFGHGPDDVFPEEWPRMLGLSDDHRAILEGEFGHLFDHRFWRRTQREIAHGEPYEVPPYPDSARL